MDAIGDLDTLIGLETARTRAWLEGDPGPLEALLDENFVEINYFGCLSKRDNVEGRSDATQTASMRIDRHVHQNCSML